MKTVTSGNVEDEWPISIPEITKEFFLRSKVVEQ